MTKELRVSHVEKLKTVLKNGYNQNSHMLMAVHADCNLADFNPNDVTYKVIGGNHTRCALQELSKDSVLKPRHES